MLSSKIKFLIGIVSIIFVLLISSIVILEILNIKKMKNTSFNNFQILKNNLNDNSFSKLQNLNNFYKTMDNIKAFQIKTTDNLPIYLYSKLGLEPSYVDSEFLTKNKSYFDIIYSDTIKAGKLEFNINAIFSVLKKKEISSFFIKISLILLGYILVISIFMIIEYHPNTKLKLQNIDTSNNFTIQKISDELKKSASFDQDMVLILTASSSENQINQNKIEFEKILKSYFPFHDLIFKLDKDTFGILIPNIDLENGIKLVEKFDQTFVSTAALKFPIMFGLSSRNGRLISGNIIINEAKTALKKAIGNRDFPIIGFRPNPARYREYLSKSKKRN